MLFQNGKLSVRELTEKDKDQLTEWLSNPFILEFYEGRDNPFDVAKVEDKFYNRDDGVTRCQVEYEGVNIGYIQYYPLETPAKIKYGYPVDELIFGIDQFIGEIQYWNRGIGTLLVTSMVKFLITSRKADRIVMDPQIRNTRALNCYKKCGFTKVKILPKHELHEGEYQDCWLIEYNK